MTSAIDDVTSTQPIPNGQRRESDASQGRRRSSASSAGRFSSLNHHRNQMYGDPASAARRESFNDQRRQTGWFGGLWNNWVRGQPLVAQRRGSDIDSGAETSRSSFIAEETQKTPWGVKHITGTGSAQAAFRAQHPPSSNQG